MFMKDKENLNDIGARNGETKIKLPILSILNIMRF